MATTTRKNKTQPTPKQQHLASLKEGPVAVIEKKEFLDEYHLRMLEVSTRDIDNARLLMACEEQALENLTLKLQILSTNIEKQKQNVKAVANSYENAKAKYTAYKKEIWPLYGLKEDEGLGYDSQSGQIIKQ